MFKRKFLILAIFFVGLLVISTASAEENATDAVVSMDDAIDVENDDLADDGSVEIDESDDEVLKAVNDDDNLEVTGSDFKFIVERTEVDNESTGATMFRFEWPDELMYGSNRMSMVISSNKKVNVENFYQDQTDATAHGTVYIKLKDLNTWGPGTYNYSATFYDVFDNPGVYVSSGSFIVTSKEVSVDFINITEKVINDTEDVLLTIYDPLENLNGFLYVYANNTLVYEKDLRIGNGGNGYDNITVYAKDLNKDEIFDGANNIKVLYKKLDGKQYTKQAVVHFVNIFGTIIPTYISSSWKTLVYNENKFLYAVLTDNNNSPVADKIIHIKGIGQSFTLRTNSKGEISYSLSKLTPGSYIISFEFKGDQIYKKSSKTGRVIVSKATPKITAKAKSFKKSVKSKKYKVTLKNNINKVMKNIKVTLKVNKKTYTAKTNSKGVATFKINKLTKKGKYTATIKYAGSKCYNAKSVSAKITVK